MNTVSPITFIDKLVKKNELGQPFRLSDHQREVLRLAFAFDQDGRLPWDTILYSCIKKIGKTTLNGAFTLAWGFTQEAPNEILILANDLEQTLARVFKTMEGIIQHNPELQREAEVQSRTIYLANGTTVTAISGDYAGAAGSNHGFSSGMNSGAIRANRAAGYGKNSPRFPPVKTRSGLSRPMPDSRASQDCSGICTSKSSARMSTPKAKASGSIPICQSTPTEKRASLPIGTMNPACRGRRKRTTTARKRRLRPGTYLRLHEIDGRRLRKHSSPPKCGTRASIRRIIRRSSAATRSMSVSMSASSTTMRRAWRLNGMRTARS